MTWTPETNRVTWGLLTPEEQGAMLAAKHGWRCLADYNRWAEDRHPTWSPDRVYRAIPAPVAKPPVDPAIWRFLPEVVTHMAMDANLEWRGYKGKPERFGDHWSSKEGAHDLDQFVLPTTGLDWRDSLVQRPWATAEEERQ